MHHLTLVFNRLHEAKLYLSRNLTKIDILSTQMDCLGFVITDEGIHVDTLYGKKHKNCTSDIY